ncbi:putative bifunctional diguanylate cyclase/phosphodiesterase [Aliivibrio wodanis]|uniref:putative bifunctional diguanylate cyclase/phosphodiesterase n=1 Tax=Aliivibrio wodanis TaxID=80852 RepID=UPI00406CDB10
MTSIWVKLRNINLWITAFFLLSVYLVSDTLISEHDIGTYAYFSYPILMLIARFYPNKKIAYYSALLSFSIIIIGNIIEPLDMDAIEESFIVIPLTYIILYPGSLWPIASAVILLLSYASNIPTSELEEFIEDALELLAISGFASVMSFYQQKLRKKMDDYKKDSETDFLTQLNNRKKFYFDLSQIKLKKTNQQQFALIQIDLDSFKQINDNLGHNIGDLVLIDFSARLNAIETESITAYRIGGDEFTIIIKHADIKTAADSLIQIILNFSSTPYKHLKSHYNLTTSIGVSLYDDCSNLTDLWCRNSDIAVYKAKQQGKNCARWFNQDLMQETFRHYQLEKELSTALNEKQFHLLYQPKVMIPTDTIAGVEALIRWHHPDLGVIPTLEFISIAEKSHDIIPMGQWVLNEACKQGKAWCDNGTPISISVNVSVVQLSHDDIIGSVRDALDDSGLEAKYLQLEITETALMKQPEKVIQQCIQLRKLGVQIAIDDFGIDYSSLRYLKQLPVDIIKIDKSFIDDCATNEKDHMIVRTIIQLGHNLGIAVTAEGIEDKEQLNILKIEGCDKYQGYYFSKPVDDSQINTLLLNQRILRNTHAIR